MDASSKGKNGAVMALSSLMWPWTLPVVAVPAAVESPNPPTPVLSGAIDEASYRAGAEAMRAQLLAKKYDAIQVGRWSLEEFLILNEEIKWPP
jgi:hypothetical protein